MYSLVNNCAKWIARSYRPLLSLFFVFSLSSCESDSSFSTPDPITDTTPPNILNAIPNEANSSDFEVDFDVEIIFSERMNLASLTTEGGVKFFSGKSEDTTDDSDDNVEQELLPRDALITLSEVPVTAEELITGNEIVIPATKLSLRPASGRFALNNSYTVIVESPARDLVTDDPDTAVDERNFIEGTNTVDFITQKGAWKSHTQLPNIGTEVPVDAAERAVENTENRLLPKVIANSKGDTFALWLQEGSSAGVNQLWISRYLVDQQKWSLLDANKQVCLELEPASCANAERIDNLDATSVIDYQATVNDHGQIAVVWSQASQAGGFVSIYARLYDSESLSWQAVTEISASGLANQAGNADSPKVAMDNTGNVLSIWREHTGVKTRIKTNIFQVANRAWTEAPAFIDNGTGSETQTPALAINDNGRAIAVWSQNQEGRLRIFSNRIRLSQSSDWQTPVQIDLIAPSSVEFSVGNSTKPKVAIDNNGDAIAVWLKYDGQRNNVWYNRFTGNWGALALSLEGDRRGDAEDVDLMISKDNKGLVLWKQRTGTALNELKSRLFVATTGWQDEKTITSAQQVHKQVARFDREGNANVIWQDGQTKGQLLTSYYSKLTDAWSEPEALIEERNANNVKLTALLEDGRFLSVWETIDRLSTQLNYNVYSD